MGKAANSVKNIPSYIIDDAEFVKLKGYEEYMEEKLEAELEN